MSLKKTTKTKTNKKKPQEGRKRELYNKDGKQVAKWSLGPLCV